MTPEDEAKHRERVEAYFRALGARREMLGRILDYFLAQGTAPASAPVPPLEEIALPTSGGIPWDRPDSNPMEDMRRTLARAGMSELFRHAADPCGTAAGAVERQVRWIAWCERHGVEPFDDLAIADDHEAQLLAGLNAGG